MNTKDLVDGKCKISGRGLHNLTVCSTIAVLSGLLIASVYHSSSASQAKVDVRQGFDLLTRGDVDQAISHFKKAVAVDKKAIHKYTEAEYRDPPEEALAKLALQLKMRPNDVYALEQQAEAYESANQFDKAEMSYKKAVALSMGEFTPGQNVYQSYEDLPAKYAGLLLKEGKKADAVKFVERSRPVLFFNREFESVCRDLKVTSCRDFMTKEASEEILDVLWHADGDISDPEKLPDAINKIDALIAKYPWCNQALLMKAKANIESHPDIAIACANQSLGKCPGLAEALHIRGKAHYVKHEYAQAVKDFTLALKQLPDTPQYYIEMSDAHLASGLWKEALDDLDRAERVAKPISDVVDKRAEVLECVGERSAAAREFTKSLNCSELLELHGMWCRLASESSFSDSITNWNSSSSRIQLLLDDGKPDEAEKLVDRLRSHELQGYTLRLAKSQICLLRHDNAGALAAAMEAKGLESDDAKESARSLVQIATVYEAMGKQDLAKRELQSALQIVNKRLNDKDACACNDELFERVLINVRLGSPQEDVRRDIRLALKQKDMTVLDVGKFMSKLEKNKRSASTDAVTQEIVSVHPEWKSLVDRWLSRG